ncbi:hypothetical protein IAR50_004365 [Cryptococcus sp. DSM 104548]
MRSDCLRLGLLVAHSVLTILLTVISAVLTSSFTLFIPHIISIAIWVIYIPSALILPAVRRKTNVRTVFDRAWGEMWYVDAQLSLWLLSMSLAIAQRADSTCERPYPTYPVESAWIQWHGVIEVVPRFCRIMIYTAVMSGFHGVLLVAWMVLLAKVVGKAKREGRGGWKVGVAELLRDAREGKGYQVSHV